MYRFGAKIKFDYFITIKKNSATSDTITFPWIFNENIDEERREIDQ